MSQPLRVFREDDTPFAAGRHRFSKLPHHVQDDPRLKRSDLPVLAAIARDVWTDARFVYITQAELGRHLRLTDRSVSMHMKRIQAAGHIGYERDKSRPGAPYRIELLFLQHASFALDPEVHASGNQDADYPKKTSGKYPKKTSGKYPKKTSGNGESQPLLCFLERARETKKIDESSSSLISLDQKPEPEPELVPEPVPAALFIPGSLMDDCLELIEGATEQKVRDLAAAKTVDWVEPPWASSNMHRGRNEIGHTSAASSTILTYQKDQPLRASRNRNPCRRGLRDKNNLPRPWT